MAVSDDELNIPYEIILLEGEQERVLTVDQQSSMVGVDLSKLPCSVKGVVGSEGLKEVGKEIGLKCGWSMEDGVYMYFRGERKKKNQLDFFFNTRLGEWKS